MLVDTFGTRLAYHSECSDVVGLGSACSVDCELLMCCVVLESVGRDVGDLQSVNGCGLVGGIVTWLNETLEVALPVTVQG